MLLNVALQLLHKDIRIAGSFLKDHWLKTTLGLSALMFFLVMGSYNKVIFIKIA